MKIIEVIFYYTTNLNNGKDVWPITINKKQ